MRFLPTDLGAAIEPVDHITGSPVAGLTVVQYADFECLHCARAHSILKPLRIEHADELRFVFRHFPLLGDHPRAGIAARAAVAAERQGRFWEMHDLLFEHPSRLTPSGLERHAHELDLDLDRFRRDLLDPEVTARVERDMATGRASGVRGTPAFFIGGVRYGEAWDLPALRDAILAAASGRAEQAAVRGG